MEKTTFAGLTILEPGEGLDTDNGAFIDRDRRTIDHFLRLGAKLHRHNGAAGLSNPIVPASAAVVASGGTIASDLTISIGYTLEDSQGGETMLSPLAVVSTGPPLDAPPAAPSAAIDYTAGELGADTYYYAVAWTDGDGGETPAGPAVAAERAPGFASGQVKLTNLTYGMAGAGAVEWRLFRAIGGGTYDLLATGGLGQDSYTDDGTGSVDCDAHPPTDSQNTTRQVNTLLVTLPSSFGSAVGLNLYGSVTGDFSEASSLGQYPVASAGATVTFSTLNFNDASPPDVNTSVGGASLIDPDTELLDWHWKRSVAASAALGSGALGDVKLVTGTGQLYAVLGGSAGGAADWRWIASGGGAAAGSIAASGTSGKVAEVEELILVGSGGATVSVSSPSPHQAKIVVTAPSATQGLKGDTGATGSAGATGASGATGPPGLPTVKAAGNPGASTGTKSISPTEMTGNSLGKIGSEGALDGVTLAVGDLFFSYSGSTRDGVWEVTNLGSSEARWVAKRPSGLNTSATVERSMFTVKEGTTYGHQTFMCDSTGITLGTTELVFRQVANRDYGLVSALPTTPTPRPGDRCTFIASNTAGVLWDLIYDGEGTYPWKKIGGPALCAQTGGQRELTNQTAYTNLPVDPLSIAIPLAGDYDIEIQGDISPAPEVGVFGYLSYSIGAIAASDSWGVVDQTPAAWFAQISLAKTTRQLGIAKAASIAEKARTGGTNKVIWLSRRLWADPVRVG